LRVQLPDGTEFPFNWHYEIAKPRILFYRAALLTKAYKNTVLKFYLKSLNLAIIVERSLGELYIQYTLIQKNKKP